MINKNLENLKKELEIDNMTDKEILEYSLKCSQEIKLELSNEVNKLGNYKLIKSLQRADEVILNEILRLNSYKEKEVSAIEIWEKEILKVE